MPMLSSSLCEIEFQYASTVWPDKVRPLRSVMVNETITGTRRPGVLEVFVDGEQGRLGVQRVEDGFQQQKIHAAVQQPARLLGIGRDQLIKGDGAERRVVDIRGKRGRLAGRPERARHETHAGQAVWP